MNNTLDAIKTYFKGVKTEWGKVSWPERRQVIFEIALKTAAISTVKTT